MSSAPEHADAAWRARSMSGSGAASQRQAELAKGPPWTGEVLSRAEALQAGIGASRAVLVVTTKEIAQDGQCLGARRGGAGHFDGGRVGPVASLAKGVVAVIPRRSW